MPNEMKYGNVNWPEGSPIAGERLATNGEYTGQHKGVPMQDALSGADNDPYLRARETIRCGTMTQDAADDHFPDHLVTVSYAAIGEVTDISSDGVTYDAEADIFEGVPSKTVSFMFKDGEIAKIATNTEGSWSVTDASEG